MPGSLLQLQSVGVQDVFLTENPQINIFKYSYYRYANFAIELEKLTPKEKAEYGKRMSCDIPKRGHLLSKLFLYISLPELVKTSGTYACWTDAVGHAMFSEPIELEIGGVVVDKLYPQFLDIRDEFTLHSQREGKNFMIGKSDIHVANRYNGTKPYNLIVPLEFWFTKEANLSLPILSMFSQTIKVNMKFRTFEELVNYDGATPPVYSQMIDSFVFAEYIYLDDSIVDRFRDQKHQYIIEQTQFHGDESIPFNNSLFSANLKFNHPIKELFFTCVTKKNIASNNYFVYSDDNNDPIILQASLLLDGKNRYEFLPEFYYRSMLPYSYHSVIPMKYVYCIPFSILPEQNQPMGSLNMSRFNDITLSLKLQESNPETFLYIYAVNYNIITVENGMLSMSYAM